MIQNVCRRNKFGYCHYGEKCRNKHVDQICLASNCTVYNCDKRHPKICNFQRSYGRCKFAEYCKYDHRKPKDILENVARIEILEKKIENLHGTSNIENNNKIEQLEKKIEKLVKERKDLSFEKKIEKLETIIQTLQLDFSEKINNLELRLKQEKDKTRTLEDNIEKIGSEKETTK